MNNLSWLIYAAEVASRAGGTLFVLGSLSTMAAVPTVIAGKMVAWTRYSYKSDDDWKETMASRALFGRVGVRLAVIGPLLVGISVFIPSSKTLYMIAASEAGETVATSPDAIEMMGDLKAIIKKRLKEELGE